MYISLALPTFFNNNNNKKRNFNITEFVVCETLAVCVTSIYSSLTIYLNTVYYTQNKGQNLLFFITIYCHKCLNANSSITQKDINSHIALVELTPIFQINLINCRQIVRTTIPVIIGDSKSVGLYVLIFIITLSNETVLLYQPDGM